MINGCIYFLLEMRASCAISTQHLISKYMKAMGIKRTSKKQKHQTTNQEKESREKRNATNLSNKHNAFFEWGSKLGNFQWLREIKNRKPWNGMKTNHPT